MRNHQHEFTRVNNYLEGFLEKYIPENEEVTLFVLLGYLKWLGILTYMTKPSAFIKRIGKSTFNAEQVFYSIANLFSFSNPYVGSSSLQSSKKLTVVDSGNNYFELKMQRTVSLSKNELIPIIDLTINGRGDLLMEEGPYSIILINFIKNLSYNFKIIMK